MDFSNFISYFTSSELQNIILPFKLVFFAISLFFLVMIIFILGRTKWIKSAFSEKLVEFLTYHPYGMKKITKDWAKILKKLEKGSESEYKLAIIEADEMFDNNLKKMEYTGETMEERIKQASAIFSDADQIQEARQIRNNAAYDPNYKLNLDEAKRTLEIYEQAFRDLEVF